MTKQNLSKRVGNREQIAYCRRSILTEGKSDGLRVIEVRNGKGLACTLLEGRCLDIAQLSYKGVNISFLGKQGLIAPQLCSVTPGEFSRYFHGGMLYTCGLMNIGPNSSSAQGELPLHGRLGMTPAEEVSAKVDWDANIIRVNGKMRLAMLFGHNLVLDRMIEIPIDGQTIKIRDSVENQGFHDEGIMLLYHFNFGWPMLSEHTRLEVTHEVVEPRDKEADKGMENWNTFEEPQAGYKEQVFYHTPVKGRDDKAHAKVWNDELDMGAEVTFDPSELPHLIQWKSMGAGDYALGIEPATCRVGGREEEEKAGRLVTIKPGEAKSYEVTLTLLDHE